MATTPSPPAARTASTRPFSGATSERSSSSGPHASSCRLAITAMPWSPRVPLTRISSPGRSVQSRTGARPSRTKPMAALESTMPSSSPRPSTLVSPQSTRVSASRQAASMEAWMRSSRSRGWPSSSITQSESPSTSVAPIMARSLTAPHTASRPMSPPGKKGGSTT